MMESEIASARAFAEHAHTHLTRSGQPQMYGGRPYVAHLDEVAGVLREFGQARTDALVAAYLHDTLEDTTVAAEALRERFGAHVCSVVEFCSDVPGDFKNRKERKAATYAHMRAFLDARLVNQESIEDYVAVKLADRLANLRASARDNPGLLEMYRKERDDFQRALRRPGSLESMWAEYDRILSPGLDPG